MNPPSKAADPPTAPVRVLLAGAGPFGREHLARLADRPDVEIAGVADTNPEALAHAGAASVWADPLRMIEEQPADALVVATPAGSHVEICERALEAGLCVLLEKPAATSAAAAAPLLAVAQEARGFVLPGHVLRFSVDHRALVEVVRSGRIGDILYINSRRYRDDNHAASYREVDPILMTLVHDIDLAQWIGGARFASVLARRAGGPGFRSMTTLSVATATGAICELRTAWIFPGAEAPADRVEVVGTRGSAELVVGRGISVCAEGEWTEIVARAGDDALRNEQDHFLDLIADRSRAPALGLSEAVAGLKLADAALESLRRGREIAV